MKRLTITILILSIFGICHAEDIPGSIALHHKDEIRRVAIDPGFGGPELGPVGCDNKVISKNINLIISKKVAEKLKKDLGFDVLLTRDTDKYVSLEERTAIANTYGADLFISIHFNGYYDHDVNGIETFCLNLEMDESAIVEAAKENASDSKDFRDMTVILKDLMQNIEGAESRRLSESVQKSLVEKLSSQVDNIKDRGVKDAPFYVFLGASMPAIMILPSFITNKDECLRLQSVKYQEAISSGIVDGIRAYINVKKQKQHTTSRL